MRGSIAPTAVAAISASLLTAMPAGATTFSFDNGMPDGKIATLSRPASAAGIETETADDFVLNSGTRLTQAKFFGLIPTGTLLSAISQVEIEFYHVFPADSTNPPSGNVPTRTNSPSDVEIGSATRDSAANTLSFTSSTVNPTFSVLNTVVNGINKVPTQHTGGEGPATGEEVLITVDFTTPVDLPADQYFFRPEVLLSSGNFLWLSAPKPPAPDLQSWIRNHDGIAPDWERIGFDIVGTPATGPAFDAAFSLSGEVVPEPASLSLLGAALVGMGLFGWRRSRRDWSSAHT